MIQYLTTGMVSIKPCMSQTYLYCPHGAPSCVVQDTEMRGMFSCAEKPTTTTAGKHGANIGPGTMSGGGGVWGCNPVSYIT